jgi:hypothetical protein
MTEDFKVTNLLIFTLIVSKFSNFLNTFDVRCYIFFLIWTTELHRASTPYFFYNCDFTASWVSHSMYILQKNSYYTSFQFRLIGFDNPSSCFPSFRFMI